MEPIVVGLLLFFITAQAILLQFIFRWGSEGTLGDAALTFTIVSFVQVVNVLKTTASFGPPPTPWQIELIIAGLVFVFFVQIVFTFVFLQIRSNWRQFIEDEIERCLERAMEHPMVIPVDEAPSSDRSNSYFRTQQTLRRALLEVGTRAVKHNYDPNSWTQRIEGSFFGEGVAPREKQRRDWLKFLKAAGLLNSNYCNMSDDQLFGTDLFIVDTSKKRPLVRTYTWLGWLSITVLVVTTAFASFPFGA